jgi:hypothetical protein
VDVPPPADLTDAETAVWREQGPHAVALGTLTPATALSFARYCRLVVLEAAQSADPKRAGGPNHRGLVGRVCAIEALFRLAPDGRPHLGLPAMPQTPNPLARFLHRGK